MKTKFKNAEDDIDDVAVIKSKVKPLPAFAYLS